MDTTTLEPTFGVATDSPTRSESTPRRLADSLTATEDRTDDATGETTAETTDTGDGTTGRGDRPESDPPALDRWWLLVAPPVCAVGLSAVSWLVDPNPLRTGTSASGLVAFAVLLPFFLLCVGGTLTLIRDAADLGAAEADWSPNPWQYVVPSAAALTALHWYRTVGNAGRIEGAVVFLVGSLVVTLVASSILAGPTYLFQRRRLLGAD